MATEMSGEPTVVQIDAGGQLALPRTLLSLAGLHGGDKVLVLPLRPGLVYLRKVNEDTSLSHEELSALMRAAFEDSGYVTREQVLTVVREAKKELAQEW